MNTNNFRANFKAIKLKKTTALIISSLFILSMLSTLSLPSAQAATTSTFGNTNVATTWNIFYGTKDASLFYLSQSGTIQSISVYFANSGFSAKAAIYTNSNGSPNQLVAQSNSQYVGSAGWQTFILPQTSISSGDYWLSATTNNFWASGVMSMSSSSNSHCWVGSNFNNDFSSSFGGFSGSDKGVPSIYATYTPSTTTYTQSNTQSPNLAPNPTGWSMATNGMWLSIGGVSNDVLDYNVQYNGAPSIRQDPVWSTNNYAREVNGPYLSVKPGDHIVFSCWIRTSASSFGDKDLNSGARLGIDFYGSKGAITGSVSPDGDVYTTYNGWPSNTHLNYVHWGTYTWTKIVMSFTIAQSYPAIQGYAGNWNYGTGQWVTPTAIIPFMQVHSSTYGNADSGQAWFADPQLTIN